MTIPKWRGPWLGKARDFAIPTSGTFTLVPANVVAGYTWTLFSGTEMGGKFRCAAGGQKILSFNFVGGRIYLNQFEVETPLLSIPAGFTCLTAVGGFTLSNGGGAAWSKNPAGEFNYGNNANFTELTTVNLAASIWTPGTVEEMQQQGFHIYCTNDTGAIVELDVYTELGGGTPLIEGTYEVV